MSAAPLLCAARATSAMARLSLGPLMPLLAADLSIDTLAKGQLLSAFSAGYLLTQVAGGLVADRFSPKLVVLGALLTTGLGLGMAPAAAAAFDANGLSVVYLLMGLANGPLFPACSAMLRDVPARGRARAMAIVDAGGTLGGCLATALCPVLATRLGWPQLYVLLAAATGVVAALWAGWATSPPAPPGSPGRAPGGGGGGGPGPGAMTVLCHPGPWALFWAHAVFNYANYFLNAWLPTMFVERFEETTPAMAGAYLMWPEVVGIVSRFATASLTDRLLLQEGRVSLLRVRRGSSSLAFVGQGLAMLVAVHQTQPLACVFALTLAAASQGIHSCGFKANYLDLTSAHSGALAGVGNTFASIASAAGPMITSAALARNPGDWESLFGGLFMLNVSGAAVVLTWLCVENLDTLRKPSEDGKDGVSDVWSFPRLFGFSSSRSSH